MNPGQCAEHTLSQRFQKLIAHWSRHAQLLNSLVLVVHSLLLAFLFLRLHQRWWFEDDPAILVYVKNIVNPVLFFTSPEVARGYGAGNAVAPLQLLTFWVDWQIAGNDATFFYLHNVLAVTAVNVVLYLLLARLSRNTGLSLIAALLWAWLPSTLTVEQFISTRHYIEGGFFALLSAYLLLPNGQSSPLRISAAIVCSALAMLAKDLYAPLAPMILFFAGIGQKRPLLVGAAVALALLFASYRFYLVGNSLAYAGMSYLKIREYLYSLGDVPYTLTGNQNGFLVFLLSAFALGWATAEKTAPSYRRFTIPLLLLFVASLTAFFPVAGAVFANYITPSTWYRVFFVSNTVFLIWLVVLINSTPPSWLKVALVGVIALALSDSAALTRKWWLNRSAALAAEGRFIIDEPDKVLYTEDTAAWFLDGLAALYEIKEPKFINPYHPAFATSLALTEKYDVVHQRTDSGIFVDKERHRLLAAEHKARKQKSAAKESNAAPASSAVETAQ